MSLTTTLMMTLLPNKSFMISNCEANIYLSCYKKTFIAIIVIFLPPTSQELFYLCKVLDFGLALDDLCDKYNHIVPKGTNYIKCQYLERICEKKRNVCYKLLPDIVFVFPAEVLSPMLPLNDDLSLCISEHQWLCNMI